MNKILQLKIAAMVLFWFGVIFETFVIIGLIAQYKIQTNFDSLMLFGQDNPLLSLANFMWIILAHVMHIVAGYWLSKGLRKGVVFGIIVGGWETIGFLILFQNALLQPDGLVIRILFALTIFLIISGRKEVLTLRIENWRPWKNPKNLTIQS